MHPYSHRKRYGAWSLMGFGVLWGAISIYGAAPHFGHLFPAILHDWWTHIVPLVFPSLLVAELVIHGTGLQGATAGAIRGLASWPIVGSTRILDQSDKDVSPETTYRALVWANLYNPWLFRHLWIGLWVDAVLLLSAWFTTRSFPRSPKPMRIASLKLRTASLDAMNWATILLAEITLARVMQSPSAHWLYQLWIEPTGSLRMPTLVGLGALAFNGLVFLIPLSLYAHYRGLSWRRIVRLRTIEAAWAMVLFVPLSLVVPQLRPIGLQILKHLLHVGF